LLLLLAPLVGAAPGVPENAAIMPLEGYKLHHWSLEEGSPGRINAITQTRDGFLWVGGVDGLHRFDGLTFERIGPRPTDPGRIVVARLLAARDGTLWIGLARRKGVLVRRGGKLVSAGMPNPSREVNDIAEGADGAIWVTRGGRGTKALARWHKGRWTEFGPASGLPEKPAWHPFFARDGTMWLTLDDAVYRKAPGSDRFAPTGITTEPRATLAEAPDGTIWLTEKEQTRAIARHGRVIAGGPAYRVPFGIRTLFDRHGDLWIATWSDGVFRVTTPAGPRRSEAHLTRRSGLLSDPVRAVFEDREGNIWIGSEMGLNMVRRVPISAARGVPADQATNHMLAVDGTGTVYVANDKTVFAIPARADPQPILTSPVLIEAICKARRGGIWILQRSKAMRWQGGQIAATYPLPASFAANSCGEDAQGRLWLPALQNGLWVLEGGRARAWPGIEGKAHIPGNVAIMADGRAAIHLRGSGPGPAPAATPFVTLTDSGVASDGVEGLLPGLRTLYTSGAAGLAAPLLPGSPVLASNRYPWASSINGLVQTAAGETWTVGDLGVVRMRTADLDRALATPGAPVPYRLFDFRDGLSSFVQKSSGPQIVAGKDGRIWFATRDTIEHIDPAGLTTNTRPPDQIIRAIAFGQKRVAARPGVTLAAHVTAFTIDYTATSLAVPDRVRFRYRLIGLNSDWVDAGHRRSASFSGLDPGDYRFELLAANEDGVVSRKPAVLTFTIAHAFYQTWWFRCLALLAVGGVLYLVYAIRLQQVSSQMRVRMLVRTGERERIARELHDTMLQGVQGLILRFQAVADRFGDDAGAQAILQPALERAEEVLVEGRERVTGLRRQRAHDFTEELARLVGNEIFPQDRIAPIALARRPRPIASAIVDDLLAALGEALSNAVAHSQASRIEVGLRFGRWTFAAYVRDNGIGMRQKIIAEGGTPGHFGMLGMMERIEAIGGRLVVESASGFGTVVELQIPARIAYTKWHGSDRTRH
jgi:signal transduction histidine kinase